MEKIVTNRENETIDLATEFAKELKGGEVIGLIGDLGAGKTVFTKGIARGLGIKKVITSPTFVLMKVYDVTNHPKIKKFCHIDAYRINSEKDIVSIGALEYFERNDTATVIEWADNIKKILPEGTQTIEFKDIGEKKREIIIK